MINVIYEDKHLMAVNKPPGLLVHRSNIAKDAETNLLKELRNQTGKFLYTIHRLDRKTSGTLLFALDKETQSTLSKLFQDHKIEKTYHAIVRGYTKDTDIINYPIRNEKAILKDAITKYTTLKRFEIPVAFGKHQTSRYSLIELKPTTGRYHQLRMHMAHIFHPIIGDRPHGCNKQNKLFKEKFDSISMMLHAKRLKFVHPQSKEVLSIESKYSAQFERILSLIADEDISSQNDIIM